MQNPCQKKGARKYCVSWESKPELKDWLTLNNDGKLKLT